jgi:hypothetical protein
MVLGLRKSEKTPTLNRPGRDNLLLPYEIDPDGVDGMREEMLTLAETTAESCQPSPEEPRVLIIHRKINREKRRIVNIDEVFQATVEMCPHCVVQIVDFQTFDKNGQVRLTCDASVLIGMHGSGLIHAGWINPSTPDLPAAVVEFFPFQYTCRTWYAQYAKMLRIQHYPVYTLNLNQSRWDPWHNETKVARCHTNEGECLRGRCHDFLRDQSSVVDVDYYRTIVAPLFKQLNESRAKL